MNSRKMEILKDIIVGVSGAGVGTVIMNIAKHTAPSNMKSVTKILTGIGGIVLSAMVTEQADQFVTKQIADAVNSIQEAKEETDHEDSDD